jgi:hypothetical protein
MRSLVLLAVLFAGSPAYGGHMEWEGHEPGPLPRNGQPDTHQSRGSENKSQDIFAPGGYAPSTFGESTNARHGGDTEGSRHDAEVYISGYGGVALRGSVKDIEGTGGLAGVRTSNLNHKGGPMFGAKIGVSPHSAPWFALEVEGIYISLKSKSQTVRVSGPGVFATGSVGEATGDGYGVLANAIFRYPKGPVQPYIGGGAGYMITEKGPAFQFLAGIRVKVVENFSVFGEFKYLISHTEDKQAGLGLEGTIYFPALVGGASIHF